MAGNKPLAVVHTKNVGTAIILTVIFGPLGVFYSTIIGGIIMTIVTIVVATVTLGIGLIVTWPISVLWGALAAYMFNRRILAR
jgi:hypothetical protein